MTGDVVNGEAVGRSAHDESTGGDPARGAVGAERDAATCGACGERLVGGARFCEACGAPAAGAGAADDPPAADQGEPAAAGANGIVDTGGPTERPACERCGGEIGPDGYCTTCGHRALEPTTVVDGTTLAYATHRGRRHRRNEDSGALAVTGDGWPVIVVSDGVSISPNPHLASREAVTTISERLGGAPFGGTDDLVAAAADAHAAVSAVPGDTDPGWTPDGTHPACTLVAAVVTSRTAHVLNVGDARAYVVRPSDDGWVASQVSRDHSVAAQAVEQGIDLQVALSLPGGHAITGWLGADAHDLDAHVTEVEVVHGDLVLACSDGLWNYATTDDALSDLLTAVLPPSGDALPLAAACEQLVRWALEQGGHDNITVALAPVPPSGGEGMHAPGALDAEETDEIAAVDDATAPDAADAHGPTRHEENR